jgi:hypothetical protein
MQM